MSNAERIYNAMIEARRGKITPDAYRAMVREIKAEVGEQGYEQAKVAAISFDIKANG